MFQIISEAHNSWPTTPEDGRGGQNVMSALHQGWTAPAELHRVVSHQDTETTGHPPDDRQEGHLRGTGGSRGGHRLGGETPVCMSL